MYCLFTPSVTKKESTKEALEMTLNHGDHRRAFVMTAIAKGLGLLSRSCPNR